MRPQVSRGWERLFWTVFERSANAMALVTEARRFAEVNPALLQLSGYSRDDLVGQPMWEYLPPSVEPLAESEWQRLLETGVASGEREFVRADGLRVRFEYAASPELITGRRLVLFVALRAEVETEPEELAGASLSGQSLSPREREIVELIARGKGNEEIAHQLSVSPDTVHTHVRNAKRKTGARNRAHLVAFALGHGLVAGDNSQHEA